MLNRQHIWEFFRHHDFSRYRYLGLLWLLISPIYSYGVYQQWHVNQDFTKVDQLTYMEYAEEIATEFNFRGDHNRMPIYPAIQALHYSDTQSYEDFFQDGKALNIGLSVITLLGISLFFWRILAPFSATMAFILTTIFVYPFLTPYFTVEVLFLSLFFVCFLLGGYLIMKPSPQLAIVLGTLMGITHLAKGSVVFVLAVFLAVYTLKALVDYQNMKRLGYHGLMMLGVVLSFFAVLYPYISDTKKEFGSYFYNVNTTFYIWYDSWGEVQQGTRNYGDRDHYPDMPADEIPSLSKYIREHSVMDMARRLANGLSRNFYNHTFKSYGYGKYILLYTLILAWQTYQHPTRAWLFLKRHKWLMLYCLMIFAAYHLAFAWYMPISTAKRFLLTLWLPCITIIFWLTSRLQLYRVHMLCLGIIIVDIFTIWLTHIDTYIH